MRDGEAHPVAPLIEKWNGSDWSASDAPSIEGGLAQITLVGDELWAVGSSPQGGPLMLRRTGLSWEEVPLPSATGYLTDVFGLAEDDIWAVGPGDGPLTMHWDGTAWEVRDAPGDGLLYGVAATSADDVWAIGFTSTPPLQPLVLRWQGSSWQSVPTPPLEDPIQPFLRDIAVAGDEVYVVGDYLDGTTYSGGQLDRKGIVWKWTGVGWEVLAPPTVLGPDTLLFSVLVDAAGDVWLAGASGEETLEQSFIARRKEGGWDLISTENPGSDRTYLVEMAESGETLWAVGEYQSSAGHFITRGALAERYTCGVSTPTSTPAPSPTPVPAIQGDADCDGDVDLDDVIALLSGIAGGGFGDQCNSVTALGAGGDTRDVDCDGSITPIDALDVLLDFAESPELPKDGNCPAVGEPV